MLNCLKKIVALLFLAAIILPATGQDKVVDQIVAIVGGNIILKSDIENQYLQMQAQGVTSDGDMKCEILEEFLIQKLLLDQAEQDTTIIVTDNQINSEMENRIQYYIDHLGSEAEVERYFKKKMPEIKADLKELISDQIMTSQMQGKITQNVKITPSEVRNFYRKTDPSEIPAIPPSYEYAQITVRPKIDDQEEIRVKNRLREFKKSIESGEKSFSTLAILYSEGPSAKNGGDLGYVGRAALDPAFSAEAFSLDIDEVSKVVKSEFGYHIIQVTDKRGEKIRCRHIILKPKVSIEALEKAYNQADSIALFINEEKISWEKAAALYSSDKKTRNNAGLVVNPMTGSLKFEVDQLNPDVSRILTTMKLNEISKPFKTFDDKQLDIFKIVKLISKTEGHKANLEEDYNLLSDVFLSRKREDKFQSWIDKEASKTYIRIDESYANCNFRFKKWIK